MSRSVVMRTIEELDDLFNIEQGIPKEMSGGGRRNGGCGGGVMVPYGSGLVADPGRFGFNPYAQGFVPAMHGGRIAGGAIPTPKGCKIPKKCKGPFNPWVSFLKHEAYDSGRTYNDVLNDPQAKAKYQNLDPRDLLDLSYDPVDHFQPAAPRVRAKPVKPKKGVQLVQVPQYMSLDVQRGSARRGRRNIYYY